MLSATGAVRAQTYIGFAYPAGGKQGTTVRITIGGQQLDGIDRIFVTGAGVQARLVAYNKKMNPQEVQLLQEQLRDIKPAPPKAPDPAHTNLVARIEKLVREHVLQPACNSIANLAVVDVTIAANAEPGPREIRAAGLRGLSNPLVFYVGQVPEYAAPPVPTSMLIILGKEGLSLRKKQKTAAGADMMEMAMMGGSGDDASELDDAVVPVRIPCTLNGQIISGTVDRYCFAARKGQRLVASVSARELVPYMADAVPGWFQPVIFITDAKGREVAYRDDFRFKPDPVILFEVPEDGEYTLAIHDAIFRGREDFVYRITVGELPFITSIFPLGGRIDAPAVVEAKGWNLVETRITPSLKDAVPGIYPVTVRGRERLLSNRIPFALDALPDGLEREPNDQSAQAQRVSPPFIVNGRVERPGDRDMYQFDGKEGEEVVIEVVARRLDSPLDAAIKVTDFAGKVVAFSDDVEDLGSGVNTHHADSYIRTKLPAAGLYYVQLADAQHNGGEEYAYRLRISQPQPGFALRVVPSHIEPRSNAWGAASVHVIRKDGFTEPISLSLKDPSGMFEMGRAVLSGTQTMVRVSIKAKTGEIQTPVPLTIEGVASNKNQKITGIAVPAEDRMQAFLWRHLVPAQEFAALILPPPPPPPGSTPPPKPAPAGKPEPSKVASVPKPQPPKPGPPAVAKP